MLDMLINFMVALKEWSNLLLVGVGLSAFGVYYWQKRDEEHIAATLVKGQIDSIEKCLTLLKSDYQLNGLSIYHSKVIIKDNLWDKYKHLLIRRLSQSEADVIQRFFDNAEQVERARSDTINLMSLSWEYKAKVEIEIAGDFIKNNSDLGTVSPQIAAFLNSYNPYDISYIPAIVTNALVKQLTDVDMLSGTTAYQKIQSLSYDKR